MSLIAERLSVSRNASAALRAASTEVLARFKAFAVTLTCRKAVYDLSRLDDRLLADMGITRSDLAAASRWSLWGDAGDRLSEIAEERRAARETRLGVG